MNYDEIATDKARAFLERLEVVTRVYSPRGEIISSDVSPVVASNGDEVGEYRWYKIKFTVGEGQDCYGFLVTLALDGQGQLAETPVATSCWKRENMSDSDKNLNPNENFTLSGYYTVITKEAQLQAASDLLNLCMLGMPKEDAKKLAKALRIVCDLREELGFRGLRMEKEYETR